MGPVWPPPAPGKLSEVPTELFQNIVWLCVVFLQRHPSFMKHTYTYSHSNMKASLWTKPLYTTASVCTQTCGCTVRPIDGSISKETHCAAAHYYLDVWVHKLNKKKIRCHVELFSYTAQAASRFPFTFFQTTFHHIHFRGCVGYMFPNIQLTKHIWTICTCAGQSPHEHMKIAIIFDE